MCVVHSTSMRSSTLAAVVMDMTEKLGITLPKSVILKIDQRRGDIPRNRYIRKAVERYLVSSKNKDDDNYNIAATKNSRRK
jgi:metal-responsive CopG/Arc/MetJ family transcriptional regulator